MARNIAKCITFNVSHLQCYSELLSSFLPRGSGSCPQDQLDALIAQIRTEKYFQAHGIRTPLPAARVVKEEAEFEFVDDEMVPQLQWMWLQWLYHVISVISCCILWGK